ncbi:MAG: FUSC family protein [Spirochaetales bacterium]|nr:FUSC family protein [Spirochaetales bacterium]
MLARFFRSEYTLTHPLYVAFKSALATLLALGLDSITGNSDHVSATFVAVLSIAPTVYQGLKQAALQFLGSVIGGICGALAMAIFLLHEWPLLYAIPPAVFFAIMGAFFVKQPGILIVSAFTALFLPNIANQSPMATLQMRLFAVTTGAVSGFIVNTLVSAFAHRRIFLRRRRKLYTCLYLQLGSYAELGPPALAPVFHLHGQLQAELHSALLDLGHTRQKGATALIERLLKETDQLTYVMHLVNQLYYSARAQGLALPKTVLQQVREKVAEFCLPDIRSTPKTTTAGPAVSDSLATETDLLFTEMNRLAEFYP